MALTVEQQKALVHMTQESMRAEFQRSLQAKLTANSINAATNKQAWAPLVSSGYIPGQLMP
jgi:hypothetical protein